jgi:hypothetical protein
MTKKQLIWGIIFSSIVGTLLHFTYEWSGGNPLVGIIAPTSESVPQHLKLIVTPFLFYRIFLFIKEPKHFWRFFINTFIGGLAGMAAMLLLFYGYTRAIGRSIVAIDIGIFFVSVIVTFLVTYWLDNFTKEYEIL